MVAPSEKVALNLINRDGEMLTRFEGIANGGTNYQIQDQSPPQQIPGEIRLLWAIVERSYFDVAGYSRTDRTFYTIHKAQEAFLWFTSPETEPYSYLWICEILEIDPMVALPQVRYHWEAWKKLKSARRPLQYAA